MNLQPGRKRNVLFFMLGLSSSIFWRLGVQVVLLELLAVIGVIFLFASTHRQQSSESNFRTLNLIIGLITIWLPVQIFIDLYNSAKTFETVKSISAIIALISLLICSKYFFIMQPKNIKPFLLGYVFSSIPSYLFFPNEYARSMPWKFCFSMSFTLLFFWLVKKHHVRRLFYLIGALFIISIDFLSGARSLAALTALAVITSLIGLRRKMGQLALSLILLIGGVFSIEQMYFHLANTGIFGESVREKAITQDNSGPILLVARSEFLYELQAIRENPFFGKGSNPMAGTDTLNEVWKFESELGINTKATASYHEYGRTQQLPQHSMLFTAWLEGGVVAALPWFIILFLFVKWSLLASLKDLELSYVVQFMSIAGVWAVLFSPLGTGSRLLTVLTLMLGFHCNQRKEFSRFTHAI